MAAGSRSGEDTSQDILWGLLFLQTGLGDNQGSSSTLGSFTTNDIQMTQQMCQVLSRSEAASRYKPHLHQVCQLKAKTNILELFIHFLHIFFPLAIFENFSFVSFWSFFEFHFYVLNGRTHSLA